MQQEAGSFRCSFARMTFCSNVPNIFEASQGFETQKGIEEGKRTGHTAKFSKENSKQVQTSEGKTPYSSLSKPGSLPWYYLRANAGFQNSLQQKEEH